MLLAIVALPFGVPCGAAVCPTIRALEVGPQQPQGAETQCQYPQRRPQYPGPERQVTRRQHENDETNIRNAGHDQVEPIYDVTMSQIEEVELA